MRAVTAFTLIHLRTLPHPALRYPASLSRRAVHAVILIIKHSAIPFTVRYTVTLKSENMLLLSMFPEDMPADTPEARPHPFRGQFNNGSIQLLGQESEQSRTVQYSISEHSTATHDTV
jgi:hypothetical protein